MIILNDILFFKDYKMLKTNELKCNLIKKLKQAHLIIKATFY